MDALEKQLRINDLLYFYEPLLTPKQQKILHYYYSENYTLKEIAQLEDISRNAVHDHIQNAVQKLENFEKQLQLKSKQDKRDKIIQKLLESTTDETLKKLINQLEKVA